MTTTFAPEAPSLQAEEIVLDWTAWHGQEITSALQDALRSQVESLLLMGYTVPEIKYGMAFFYIEHAYTFRDDNQSSLARSLDALVWRWSRDTRSGSQAWRREMKARIAAVTPLRPHLQEA